MLIMPIKPGPLNWAGSPRPSFLAMVLGSGGCFVPPLALASPIAHSPSVFHSIPLYLQELRTLFLQHTLLGDLDYHPQRLDQQVLINAVSLLEPLSGHPVALTDYIHLAPRANSS